MKKVKEPFFVISRFSENVEWIREITDNYIIYNKGEELDSSFHQKVVPNFGGNQYDIFNYIVENYDNLPDLIAFVQGNPFDHCIKERFLDLIKNDYYTHLFGDSNYPDGEYTEENNNWYIGPVSRTKGITSSISSFDEYAEKTFKNYTHLNFLKFPPGSQILVEKERCLYYSKKFWNRLMGSINQEIGMNGGVEAHIVERSIDLIFQNIYEEKE
jgi:hypothetical protein